MIIKKYKHNKETDSFEFIQDIKDVPDDKAYVEMTMDPPVEVDTPDQNADFLYEAGKMVDETFYVEFTWQSENGDLFN